MGSRLMFLMLTAIMIQQPPGEPPGSPSGQARRTAICPRCKGQARWQSKNRYHCTRCGYRFTVDENS